MADEWIKHAADDDAAPHAARGYALRLLGRNAEARKSLDRALDRDSVHFAARVNHGIIMLAERRLDDARHDAETLMRVAPERMNGHALAGFVALAESRCADVVRHWGNANRIEPGWVEKDENVLKAYRECRKRAGAKG
jgi:tetratricopeptide (TPR) repeat protein